MQMNHEVIVNSFKSQVEKAGEYLNSTDVQSLADIAVQQVKHDAVLLLIGALAGAVAAYFFIKWCVGYSKSHDDELSFLFGFLGFIASVTAAICTFNGIGRGLNTSYYALAKFDDLLERMAGIWF